MFISIPTKIVLPVMAAGAMLLSALPGPAHAETPIPASAPIPAPAATPKDDKDQDNLNGDHVSGDTSDGKVTLKARRKARAKAAAPAPQPTSTKTTKVSNGSGGGPSETPRPRIDQNATIVCNTDIAIVPGSERGTRLPSGCRRVFDDTQPTPTPTPEPGEPPAPPPPPVVTIARQAVASLTLPEVNPIVQPDPQWNEWKAYVLGDGLWIWTESPNKLHTTVTQQGITIEITAVRDNIVFDMGDGKQVTCTHTTKYQPLPDDHFGPWDSPDCGYTYRKLPKTKNPSYPQDWCREYTMTATAHWTITWSALDATGKIPMTRTQTKRLPIIELQSVLIDPDAPPEQPQTCPNR